MLFGHLHAPCSAPTCTHLRDDIFCIFAKRFLLRIIGFCFVKRVMNTTPLLAPRCLMAPFVVVYDSNLAPRNT